MKTCKDLSGKKFGLWTVLRRIRKYNQKSVIYECACKCGNTKEVYSTHLVRGTSKSCGCNFRIGYKHHQWGGYHDISGNFWYDIKAKANSKRRHKIDFKITKEEAWEVFIKQDKKCALTGLDININFRRKTGPTHTASLDRIDSSKGYTPDNIQWVHKDVNIMKNSFMQQYFIEIAHLISKKHPISQNHLSQRLPFNYQGYSLNKNKNIREK